MQIPLDYYYYFENDCLIPMSYFENQDPKKIKLLQRQNTALWESNAEQFQELIETVLKMQPQKTQDLLDLLVKKESMIKIACEKQSQIKLIEKEKVNIQQRKNTIQCVQSEIMNRGPDSDYIPIRKEKQVKRTRTRTRSKTLSQKATFCCNCLSLCHNPCNLEKECQRGSIVLKECSAFDGNNICQKCNHSVDYHTHTDVITEEYQEEYYDFEPYVVWEEVKKQNTIKRKETLQQEQQKHEKEIKQL